MRHHIQIAILNQLATAHTLPYAGIKPDNLDGNVFGYHLKQVMRDRLVEKTESGRYSLTTLGKEYIVHRYETDKQPHAIFLIVLRRGDEYLIRRRNVQPLLGYDGFIHGEPSSEDSSLLQTAQKRLELKTGIQASLEVAGSGLIRIEHRGEQASYSLAVILTGSTEEDITVSKDETGTNSWALLSHPDLNLLPSTRAILRMIAEQSAWFESSESTS